MLSRYSSRPLGWLSLLMVAATMMVAAARSAQAQEAVYVDRGPHQLVYSRVTAPVIPRAGIFIVEVEGTEYPAYCLDLYTNIELGNSLLLDGVIAPDVSSDVDWAAVQFLIYTYGLTADPTEAAAVNCAIWFFTTAPYGAYPGSGGFYRFMTDPQGASNYDGWNPSFGSAVRDRAFELIASVPVDINGVCTFQVPTELTLAAQNDVIVFQQGTIPNTTVGAHVLDSYGNPVPNVLFLFAVDNSTLTGGGQTAAVLTNNQGFASVTLTNSTGKEGISTICAFVDGDYAILLRGDVYDPQRQDMALFPLLPDTISDCIDVEWKFKQKDCQHRCCKEKYATCKCNDRYSQCSYWGCKCKHDDKKPTYDKCYDKDKFKKVVSCVKDLFKGWTSWCDNLKKQYDKKDDYKKDDYKKDDKKTTTTTTTTTLVKLVVSILSCFRW